MANPLSVTYTDLQGPPVSAAWLNAAGRILSGSSTPTILTATAGQTVFPVPAGQSNFVFVNGLFQVPSINYTWTSTTSITFASGLTAGSIVTVL